MKRGRRFHPHLPASTVLHDTLSLRHTSKTCIAKPSPLSLALTRDGTRAATSSYDTPGVRVWELPSAKMLRELPVDAPTRLTFTPIASSRRCKWDPNGPAS